MDITAPRIFLEIPGTYLYLKTCSVPYLQNGDRKVQSLCLTGQHGKSLAGENTAVGGAVLLVGAQTALKSPPFSAPSSDSNLTPKKPAPGPLPQHHVCPPHAPFHPLTTFPVPLSHSLLGKPSQAAMPLYPLLCPT